MSAAAGERHAGSPPYRPAGAPPDFAAAAGVMNRVVADMSGAMTAVLCALGVRLDLFGRLAAIEPATSAELATAAGLDERYVREWLHGLAGAGYLDADRGSRRFALAPGVAAVVALPGSPFDMSGGYRLIPPLVAALAEVAEAFRTGAGVPHERYSAELYEAMERMSASWLETMLVSQWIPAVDGLTARLGAGGRVADVGCGGGRALVLAARAFPASTFVGYDSHPPNARRADEAARRAGVAGRVTVIAADAADPVAGLDGHFDLVTAFDTLHDAPDPAALLARIRAAVDPGGVLLLLESKAADDPLDNEGPAAMILYATSVLYCLPTSRADGGPGLGTLGLPPERIRELCGSAGFRSIRTIPNPNPFNALYEIRP